MRRGRVLILEDEPVIGAVAAELSKASGHAVELAAELAGAERFQKPKENLPRNTRCMERIPR